MRRAVGPANTYHGLHARYYDEFYSEKPYAAEARFVDAQFAAKVGQRRGELLDVACGTGRHALEFAALGWTVTGIDISAELIALARARDARAEFQQHDMADFDLGRRFTAITCLFDSIGYAQTNETIIASLERMARHLTPDGLVAIEFLHAATALLHNHPVKVRRRSTEDGGRILRISETNIDARRSVMAIDYELWKSHPDGGEQETWSERQFRRFFTVEEMRALMASAGLTSYAFLPAFSVADAISASTWRVLGLAGVARRGV